MRISIVSLIAAGLAFTTAAGAAQVLEHDLAAPRPMARMETAAYQDRRGPIATESFSRRVRLGSGGRISLSNLSGAIIVSGGAGEDVSIEATKRTRGDGSLLAAVRIEVEERAGRLDIRTVYPSRGRREEGVSVDYTLMIPDHASIDVSSISGSVRVSNVKGTISASTVSGDVTLSGASRLERAKAISGTIELADSTLEAEAEMSTVSGSLRIRDVKAAALQLKTVSGRLEATGVSSERLDMQSISGRIDFAGRLSRNGRYNFGSHSGSVRLALVGDTGFDLDASSFSGSIRSDFAARTAQTQRNNRGPSRNARSLRTTSGDGSAMIHLQTFSGSILIEKR
jgi:DUF4097 and DUF4098 domain-containing protein YvlB